MLQVTFQATSWHCFCVLQKHIHRHFLLQTHGINMKYTDSKWQAGNRLESWIPLQDLRVKYMSLEVCVKPLGLWFGWKHTSDELEVDFIGIRTRPGQEPGWLPHINTRGWVAPVTLKVTLLVLFPHECQRMISSDDIHQGLVCLCHIHEFSPDLAWPVHKLASATCTVEMYSWNIVTVGWCNSTNFIVRTCVFCLSCLSSKLIFIFACNTLKINWNTQKRTVLPVPNTICGWMCKQNLSCTCQTLNFQHCRQLRHLASSHLTTDFSFFFFGFTQSQKLEKFIHFLTTWLSESYLELRIRFFSFQSLDVKASEKLHTAVEICLTCCLTICL